AAAEDRLAELDERLTAAQRARGDAERVVDALLSDDADVRDLVRVTDARAASIERERAEIRERRERLATDRGAARSARAKAAEGSRRESEQRLAKARERLAELRGERGKLAVEEERAAGALRLLEEQVRAELGLPEDEPLPDPTTLELEDEGDEKDRGSTLAALTRLRRRLIALEPVNPLAATELAEIGQRHDFLATQKTDLERAMADLRTLADELAATIAEQFSTTLMAVDREFG